MRLKPIFCKLFITQHNNNVVCFQLDCSFAKDLQLLLNSIEYNLYDQPFHRVYYIIDNLVETLEKNGKISNGFANHVSAMLNSNRGENFLLKFLGRDFSKEYDDIIKKPIDIVVLTQY